MEPKKVIKDVMAILREKNLEMSKQLRILEAKLASSENEQAKLLRTSVAATADAEALLGAVRVLSDMVESKTSPGRKARQDARQLIEQRGMQPPYTLGSSRVRHSKKKT
jgi:hypothetical protein